MYLFNNYLIISSLDSTISIFNSDVFTLIHSIQVNNLFILVEQLCYKISCVQINGLAFSRRFSWVIKEIQHRKRRRVVYFRKGQIISQREGEMFLKHKEAISHIMVNEEYNYMVTVDNKKYVILYQKQYITLFKLQR